MAVPQLGGWAGGKPPPPPPPQKKILRTVTYSLGPGRILVLREIGWGCMEWIELAQDWGRWLAVLSVVMNLRVLAPRS
jgi:hypothetical protein